MSIQKYSVNQHLLETVLAWVNSGEIAIPEIQRPFVWDSTQVRDLMDSLYQGYPVGYLIAWKNPNVRLKDGSYSEGKKILIDGQQRVTAMTAALLGQYVVNKDYKQVKINIAFHPTDERFEVTNPAIRKSKDWIPDIGPIVRNDVGVIKSVKAYCEDNPEVNPDKIEEVITNLTQLSKKQIGLIELTSDLDITTVTEIFIRINSKGVALSQADFVMSKIASTETYGGPDLRKSIDYFAHLAVAPEFYPTIRDEDKKFAKTEYFKRMTWLKDENDDLYDPKYKDLLRVAFISRFNRGRFEDLVSLLSGRNFETREYEEQIAEESFGKLEEGVLDFINESNFKKFTMIIRSAGFVDPKQIRSETALNVAYAMYLRLRAEKLKQQDIERYVRQWFVMSVLTGRYSGSAESQIDFDIRQVSTRPFGEVLEDVQNAELSDSFWAASLVQALNTPVVSNPLLKVFWAAQVQGKDKGFLSRDITVSDLVTMKGDVHHIFPKNYLKKKGLRRAQYNQVANFVYTQSEINVQIGDKEPQKYMGDVLEQCSNGNTKYGGITDEKKLAENLRENCIPEEIIEYSLDDYGEFLQARRLLMATRIKDYYFSL
jgi:hypothetical protein